MPKKLAKPYVLTYGSRWGFGKLHRRMPEPVGVLHLHPTFCGLTSVHGEELTKKFVEQSDSDWPLCKRCFPSGDFE